MSWSLFGKKKSEDGVVLGKDFVREALDNDVRAWQRAADEITGMREVPFGPRPSLAKQLAAALNAARKPDSPAVFAQRIGLPVLTVKRFCAGQAMKIQALEKLATGMGWTISITDKDGKEVVHL